MKPPKGPPFFFSQFDHGIYWKYHGNIVGYDGVYRYNLCMRYRGWLPNSTPVEGCGKRKPWVSTCFSMFQPSKGGAGFRRATDGINMENDQKQKSLFFFK